MEFSLTQNGVLSRTLVPRDEAVRRELGDGMFIWGVTAKQPYQLRFKGMRGPFISFACGLDGQLASVHVDADCMVPGHSGPDMGTVEQAVGAFLGTNGSAPKRAKKPKKGVAMVVDEKAEKNGEEEVEEVPTKPSKKRKRDAAQLPDLNTLVANTFAAPPVIEEPPAKKARKPPTEEQKAARAAKRRAQAELKAQEARVEAMTTGEEVPDLGHHVTLPDADESDV